MKPPKPCVFNDDQDVTPSLVPDCFCARQSSNVKQTWAIYRNFFQRSDTITRRPDVRFPKKNRQVFWGNPSPQMGPHAFFKRVIEQRQLVVSKFFWKCSPKNILGEIIPNITCPVAFGKGFYFEDLVTGSPSSPHIVGFGASCNEPFFESQSHQSKDFEGMEDPGESFQFNNSSNRCFEMDCLSIVRKIGAKFWVAQNKARMILLVYSHDIPGIILICSK